MDLTRATNLARCGQVAACTDSDMKAVTDARPWGANNPRWQLYAYGPVARLLAPGEIDSRVYVMVWVGDDPSEIDGDPLRDGTAGTSPGHDVLVVRAEAFATGGGHRTVEVTIGRTPYALRRLSWRAP